MPSEPIVMSYEPPGVVALRQYKCNLVKSRTRPHDQLFMITKQGCQVGQRVKLKIRFYASIPTLGPHCDLHLVTLLLSRVLFIVVN